MKNWLHNCKIYLYQFMQGRYGNDALTHFLHITVLILLLLSFIPVFAPLSLAASVILILTVCRTLSRNIAARQKELHTFLRIRKKTADQWKLYRQIWRERKTHAYFRCPKCRAMLRVPKGRGEIVVTCPKCSTKTDKKT